MVGLARAMFRGHTGLIRLILTLICWATHAQATAPEAAPIRTNWSTSAGCGNASAFLAELQSRTSRVRAARGEEHAITFVVETFPTPAGVRGQLTIHRPGERPVIRDVPGASCGEVVSAMALIAALTIDRPAIATLSEPNRSAAGTYRAPTQAQPGRAWSLRAEHQLTARNAVAPSWAWGQSLGLQVIREHNSLHPSLGVAFLTTDSTTRVAGGSAQFAWQAGQLALCPLGLEAANAWDVRVCASFEVGRLRGIGFATPARDSKSILWSSASLLLALRRELVGPLWVGTQAGLSLPFTREHFYIEPQSDLHRVPAWGGSFGLGLGLRFL